MAINNEIAEILTRQNENLARWALDRHPEIALKNANEIISLLAKEGYGKMVPEIEIDGVILREIFEPIK